MSEPKDLTTREEECLDVIRAFIARNNYPPTFFEIGAALGLSQKPIKQRLDGLLGKGFIAREPGKSRSIRILKEP
jgi:SOS-response transcriptional repressor LexA